MLLELQEVHERYTATPGSATAVTSAQQELLSLLPGLQLNLVDVQLALESASKAAADASTGASSGQTVTSAVTALLPGLGGRLVACGEALAALCPVPLCCNNPGCVELRGASELQLVKVKGSRCSQCM
jgi:hypothetical protein